MLDLPQKETEEFLHIARRRIINKHDFFILNGDIPQKVGYVLSGLFRYVYFDASGDEFTKSLIPEANFIVSYSAMINGHGSYFAIQALEDSTILEIDYQQWLSLKEENPVWNLFLVNLLEKAFAIKEKRERDLLLLDAETRYQNFLEEFPQMENRVKQHIIASYLGIKPESLSRIKKKIVS
ncbi:Crp/Fnr family transcriptional regulator [Larkinella sp. VNQ87]|uniref:Crp/Fnr family transcriptional regulator n=1 Tax=Larkinella sp. VNQ87 TaxID=3400921 RepID=UPI003C0ABCAE